LIGCQNIAITGKRLVYTMYTATRCGL